MLTTVDYDTLSLIFKQCGPSELLKLRSCCKQFKKIVDSPFFLKNHFIFHWRHTKSELVIGKNPHAKAPRNLREYYRRYRNWRRNPSGRGWYYIRGKYKFKYTRSKSMIRNEEIMRKCEILLKKLKSGR